jgi:hypothetical protein
MARIEVKKNNMVECPEGKRPLGRPRHKWKDKAKMDLVEIVWGGVVWNGLTQDRDMWRAVVNAVMNIRFL